MVLSELKHYFNDLFHSRVATAVNDVKSKSQNRPDANFMNTQLLVVDYYWNDKNNSLSLSLGNEKLQHLSSSRHDLSLITIDKSYKTN